MNQAVESRYEIIEGRKDAPEKAPFKMKTLWDKGYVWAPYIPVVTAIWINGEMTWHKNKFINLLLKVKRLFSKPRYTKLESKYTKPVNPNHYGLININCQN